MDNPFTRKQLDARLEAERDMIMLYAESCFLSIQVLSGDLSGMKRLEQLDADLGQVEHRLHRIAVALFRLGVPAGNIHCLDEQERLDLFEAHFADPETPVSCSEGLFGPEDMREMLRDLYGSLQVNAAT
ncbi:MAG: hypothetical protein ACE5FQ_13695 [Thiogranum sp.]